MRACFVAFRVRVRKKHLTFFDRHLIGERKRRSEKVRGRDEKKQKGRTFDTEETERGKEEEKSMVREREEKRRSKKGTNAFFFSSMHMDKMETKTSHKRGGA